MASATGSAFKINMRPVMTELCTMEGTCHPTQTLTGGNSIITRSVSAHTTRGLTSSTALPAFSSLSISTSQPSLAFTPLNSSDYDSLVAEITQIASSNNVPARYKVDLIIPFLGQLHGGGKTAFSKQLFEDGRPIERVAQAILQNFGSTTETKIRRQTTEAVREVISDLYQAFLSNGCTRSRVCLNHASPIPNWYEEGLSTYSHPLFNTEVRIVNVPSRYAAGSAIAWGCLGHEVTGHDILAAYDGALDELQDLVETKLEESGLEDLAPSWKGWLEEAAADVLGVLNMGPAAAFSLIGFLRSRSAEFRLNSVGILNDEHPIDLLRGFLVAYTVKLMPQEIFRKAPFYAKLIMDEVNKDAKDVTKIALDGTPFGKTEEMEPAIKKYCREVGPDLPDIYRAKNLSDKRKRAALLKYTEQILNSRKKDSFIEYLKPCIPQKKELNTLKKENELEVFSSLWPSLKDCKKSARIIANIIMNSELEALGNRSFLQIKSWTDSDEKLCAVFRNILTVDKEVVASFQEGFFASHVVSAAVLESITEEDGDPIKTDRLQTIFKRMVSNLQKMNRTNPQWQNMPRSSDLEASPLSASTRTSYGTDQSARMRASPSSASMSSTRTPQTNRSSRVAFSPSYGSPMVNSSYDDEWKQY